MIIITDIGDLSIFATSICYDVNNVTVWHITENPRPLRLCNLKRESAVVLRFHNKIWWYLLCSPVLVLMWTVYWLVM